MRQPVAFCYTILGGSVKAIRNRLVPSQTPLHPLRSGGPACRGRWPRKSLSCGPSPPEARSVRIWPQSQRREFRLSLISGGKVWNISTLIHMRKVYALAWRVDRRGRQQAHRRSARDYKMRGSGREPGQSWLSVPQASHSDYADIVIVWFIWRTDARPYPACSSPIM